MKIHSLTLKIVGLSGLLLLGNNTTASEKKEKAEKVEFRIGRAYIVGRADQDRNDYVELKNGASCAIIADGHGSTGDKVAQAIVNILPKLIYNAFSSTKPETKEKIQEAFNEAFLKMQNGLKNEIATDSGACAAVVYISPLQEVYIATLGDSRIVFAQDGEYAGSPDHKASDATEKERIKKDGGFVKNERVGGVLAVSRAFGDKAIKGVSQIPFVKKIETNKLDFIIMACDGLWDGVSTKDAITFANKTFAKNESTTKTAEALAELGRKEYPYQDSIDDTTVIFIKAIKEEAESTTLTEEQQKLINTIKNNHSKSVTLYGNHVTIYNGLPLATRNELAKIKTITLSSTPSSSSSTSSIPSSSSRSNVSLKTKPDTSNDEKIAKELAKKLEQEEADRKLAEEMSKKWNK